MNNSIAKIQKYFQTIKLLSIFNPPSYFKVKSKIRLNARILRLNFLNDLAKGVLAPLPWLRHCLRPQNL